jgi:molecular chaperone GrpE
MAKRDSKKKGGKNVAGEDVTVEAENGGVEADASDDDNQDGRQEEALSSIDKLEEELAEARDKHLRAVAELDNFKRRTAREKAELSAHVKVSVFSDILGVVDDFDRFFQHVENAQSELDDGFVQGVELIHKSLQKALDKHGVEPVAETGVLVDYNLHEAVMTAPVEDREQDHTVLEILEVGYRIGETLIRPAKVKVAIFGG